MTACSRPLLPLAVNGARVWRPFIGGRELDRLAALPQPADGHFSEEWMLSAVRANNPGRDEPDAGLCRLAEDVLLRELIASDPASLLGKDHAARYGAEMGVLVKLIDSRDRLRLQVHPDKALARSLFGMEFGKTECWYVLGLRQDGGEPPRLYLGFRRGISRDAWRDAFLRQDREAMFGMLHSFAPEAGGTYLVPGGMPHAIGAGCLVAEIQEPTDITVRLERTVPGGSTISDEAMHQGLGFERMFDCFHYDGRSAEETLAACLLPPRTLSTTDGGVTESLVPHAATGCFAMERITVPAETVLPPSTVFSGLYVVDGAALLLCGGLKLHAKRHSQFFLPPLSEPLIITNEGGGHAARLLRFYGPTF